MSKLIDILMVTILALFIPFLAGAIWFLYYLLKQLCNLS